MMKIKNLFIFIFMSIFLFSIPHAKMIEMQPNQPVPVEKKPTDIKPTPELPDLILGGSGLNEQCKIWFTIKNKGKGKVDEKTYMNTIIRLSYGFKNQSMNKKEYTLNQIDPQRLLNTPFASVTYVTDIFIIPPLHIEDGLIIDVAILGKMAASREIRNEFRLKGELFKKEYKLGEKLRIEWDIIYDTPCKASKPLHIWLSGRPLTGPGSNPPANINYDQKFFEWTIPETKFNPGKYCLRIEKQDYGCEIKIYGGINLVSPNETAVWNKGDKTEIKWEGVGWRESDLEIYLLNRQNNAKINLGKTKVKSGIFPINIDQNIPDGTYNLVLDVPEAPKEYYYVERGPIHVLRYDVDLEVKIGIIILSHNPVRCKVYIAGKNKGNKILDNVPFEWVISTIKGNFLSQGNGKFSKMYPNVIYYHYLHGEIGSDRTIQAWIDPQNNFREPEFLRANNYDKQTIYP
ncbi:MAG: hypothetical protein N2202_09870 [Proteobacteria bacterium]|nr:hypothetical protein [Pseudomonadota bacterium]